MSIIEEDVMTKKTDRATNFTNLQPKMAINEPLSEFIDNINFDDTAKQMAELKAIIFDTPDTNETKIQFIKEELSAGRYQIHSNRIATKLMEYSDSTEQAEIA
jgi:flagellar biosynthesis anti-sigma factor FlgM